MTTASVLRHIRASLRDERGSVAIHIGLMMIVLIGMGSLGIETGTLYLDQRKMQAAADAAAVSAAVARATGRPSDFRVEAKAVASSFGFTDGVDGTTIAINSPPARGPNMANSAAVEVIVGQPQELALAKVFRSDTFDVGARAVATVGGGPSYCVLQLDPHARSGFTMNNGATVTLDECGVAVNSDDRRAFSMSGGARLYTPKVSVVGDASVSNGARINPDDALETQQPAVSDPYADVAVPPYSGCSNGEGRTYNWGNWVLTPGVYCDGVRFRNAANVTMKPGIYFIDRGTFEVGGGVKLSGIGVTIVLTSREGEHPATIDIGNGADVELTAPTTGPTAGIVFFGDRLKPDDHDMNTFGGGASITLVGAIYFPRGAVTMENGASNTSDCTQLIAATIELKGGSRFRNNCPQGVSPIVGGAGGGGASRLVE